MNDIIKRIEIGGADFPPQLTQLKGGPKRLFVRGNINALVREPLVAVVGTRKITPYGQMVVKRLVPAWARAGITVVSGLALGTDALAHQTALEAGGTTLAVLGSGIDDPSITPRTNFNLAQRMLNHDGALVSEYEPGTPAEAFRFPERNRIVAGLAQATVVIEGTMRSGTLITAKCMLEYGRDVFAVPGPITVQSSAAPNWLISQGAHPLLRPEDLLEHLDIKENPAILAGPSTPKLSESAENVLRQLRLNPATADQLIESTRLDSAAVLGAISELELSGTVFRGGDLYTVTD